MLDVVQVKTQIADSMLPLLAKLTVLVGCAGNG
jgi:hypothetical protein